jgi:hypothetical protein
MENIEKSKQPYVADLSLVLSWISHIENPCEDGKGNNLRDFYLRGAKELLEIKKFQDPHAKQMLENVIKKYEA